MAFIFTMRSPTAEPSTTSSSLNPNSIGIARGEPGSIDERLSTIMENGDAPATNPQPQSPSAAAVKASHRPSYRRWQLGSPPAFRFESPPPPYIEDIGPHGEKLSDVRNNKYIARRGGWKRLCIALILILAIITAVAVGLGLGLKKKSSSKSGANGNSTAPTGPFPVGQYSIVTYLDSVTTGCATNAATWLCYPYTTYNQSTTNSAATFDWIISAVQPTASSASNLTISSSNNPFALTFSDVPLDLLDQGQSTERYRFQVPMDKLVVPTVPITSDNSRAECWFNGTTFQAQLYTKQAKTYPPPNSGPPSAGGTPTAGMAPWPYAVDVKQVIGGGDSIPECFKVVNGNVGDQITNGIGSTGAGGLCSCEYENFNGTTSS